MPDPKLLQSALIICSVALLLFATQTTAAYTGDVHPDVWLNSKVLYRDGGDTRPNKVNGVGKFPTQTMRYLSHQGNAFDLCKYLRSAP